MMYTASGTWPAPHGTQPTAAAQRAASCQNLPGLTTAPQRLRASQARQYARARTQRTALAVNQQSALFRRFVQQVFSRLCPGLLAERLVSPQEPVQDLTWMSRCRVPTSRQFAASTRSRSCWAVSSGCAFANCAANQSRGHLCASAAAVRRVCCPTLPQARTKGVEEAPHWTGARGAPQFRTGSSAGTTQRAGRQRLRTAKLFSLFEVCGRRTQSTQACATYQRGARSRAWHVGPLCRRFRTPGWRSR